MALSGCFGFPNIGSSLDISHKIQGFLNNDVLQETLEISTKKIRLQKWITQKIRKKKKLGNQRGISSSK